ncbi:hypothetical protein CcCBS67573_g09483 [Chytriomyces confervae]|uniref:G-protein coupled receptors family 1 profile domain-containing protein n=1 Tax=Chytriomyces confervae TaxID=246404 RepID=A0A507DWJ9_9FUNG|nr:hypothetical protein CcCBS67573_g09483 [Chytriomyces confervae]
MSNLTVEGLNQSSQAEPVFMFTYAQSMAFALVSGLTIEISCSGLISAACQFFEDPKLTYALVITAIFNISAIVYSSITVWASLLGEENCIMGQMISTVSKNEEIRFDIFMLMKAYAVSGLHPKVYYSCLAVGAYRVGWAIADIVESHGFWDAEVGSCAYYQNPITGIGYNSADIVVDAFATIIALLFNWKHLKTSLTQIRRVLIQENLLRSIIILALNSFEIYAAVTWTDQFNSSMAFLAQNYIYTRCVNAETLFKSIRKNAIHQTNDSHKNSQVVNKSHASKVPSNNHLTE